MSASTAAVVLAALGVAVSAVSAGVAVIAVRRSSRRDARIEQLEAETLAHATGYRLTVRPSDTRDWSLVLVGEGSDETVGVEGVLAHVTNTGAVDSPPVTVRAYVDGVEAGESEAFRVDGKRDRDFAVPFSPYAGTMTRNRSGCRTRSGTVF